MKVARTVNVKHVYDIQLYSYLAEDTKHWMFKYFEDIMLHCDK